MPEIKIQHVVSCSSEDKNNPAENILKSEGTHKWKCATPGEKSVSIVLQFEKASQVHSIDIGNEGSAFIEVLVGRSSATMDQDYQVLLVASSFMLPLEARSGTNRTGVRMFGTDKFNKTVVGENWDRVKIVCTQPFNKTITFGLSFVKFHSPGGPLEMEKKKTIGFFKMKNEEGDGLHTGSMFSHRTTTPAKTESPAPVTGAAAMRAASRLAEESKPSTSRTPSFKTSPPADQSVEKRDQKPEIQKRESKPAPSNREKRKHSSSDDEPRAPSRKHSTPARKPSTSDDDGSQPPLRKRSTSLNSSSSLSSVSEKPDSKPKLKRILSMPPKDSPTKAFRRLMEGVVFVMSGFQNPYRAELRDRALGMGATYKPDWGKGCTHLVCAFPNTPKYNQVSGEGKIVSKKWVHDCYKQKKLLPWRHYRLGDADSPDESSEDEVIVAKKPKKVLSKSPSVSPKKASPVKQSIPLDADDDDNVYDGDTDSGDDTEEEVRRIKAGITKNGKTKSPDKKPSPVKHTDPDDDIYGAATDEDEAKPNTSKQRIAMETDDGSDSGLPDLPDFFSDKKFFFYGKMDAKDRRLLTRYIAAYDGEVEEYMGESVNYVVTSSPWDDNFDNALADNGNLVFVKPKWIHVCHGRSKLVPHQPYIVVPDA